MWINNWKDLPVLWVEQMENKNSGESSKGSDFVEQNYLEKQFQMTIRLACILKKQERNRGKSKFISAASEGRSWIFLITLNYVWREHSGLEPLSLHKGSHTGVYNGLLDKEFDSKQILIIKAR